MSLVSHSDFILAAYGASGLILGVLILWIMADYRSLQRTLAELEDDGMTRRSDAAARSPL